MGDRRPPSKPGEVQPAHWPAEYTTDLIDLQNVLGLLVNLEPDQARLLDRVGSDPLMSVGELHAQVTEQDALETPPTRPGKPAPRGQRGQRELFDGA